MELGKGLHAVMDSTSPSHSGFQEWHMNDYSKHGAGASSMEDIGSLNPDLMRETIARMNAALNGDLSFVNCSCYE